MPKPVIIPESETKFVPQYELIADIQELPPEGTYKLTVRVQPEQWLAAFTAVNAECNTWQGSTVYVENHAKRMDVTGPKALISETASMPWVESGKITRQAPVAGAHPA